MKTYNKRIREIQFSLGSGYEELTLEEFIEAFHVTVNVANVKLKGWSGEEIETMLDAEFIHLIDPETNIEGMYLFSNNKFYNTEEFIIEW